MVLKKERDISAGVAATGEVERDLWAYRRGSGSRTQLFKAKSLRQIFK
jgi:hypothetical protein